LLRRDSADVTSANLPTRNVELTSLPLARIVLILKAGCFCGAQAAIVAALEETVGGQEGYSY
jgi:hypothetical protein